MDAWEAHLTLQGLPGLPLPKVVEEEGRHPAWLCTACIQLRPVVFIHSTFLPDLAVELQSGITTTTATLHHLCMEDMDLALDPLVVAESHLCHLLEYQYVCILTVVLHYGCRTNFDCYFCSLQIIGGGGSFFTIVLGLVSWVLVPVGAVHVSCTCKWVSCMSCILFTMHITRLIV